MRTQPAPSAEWEQTITAWGTWMTAAGRATGTVHLRTHYAMRLAGGLSTTLPNPWDATTADVAGWLAVQDWSPETRRSAIVSIRSFYSWAARTGQIPHSPAAGLDAVHIPAGIPRPAPEDALEQALAAADERTRLMIELAARAGLRRAEIAAVRGIDVEHDGIGATLRVRGKGGVERTIPISDQLATAITTRAQRETGNRFGWVFPRHSDPTNHLTPGHVGRLMTTALPHAWTPHSLRHRFASRAYAAERDIRAVQELLGHASVTTTQRYTAVPQDAKRRAVAAAF